MRGSVITALVILIAMFVLAVCEQKGGRVHRSFDQTDRER